MNEPIVIQPWMIQELHLKGAALLVFALWYADRKDRSVKELAQMLGYTEYGIRKALDEVREAQQSCLKKQLSCENGQQSCVGVKERSKENILYTNITTTASTDAHAQAFEWLTKDENWLRILCKNNGLDEETPLETLQPYIERFICRLEETGQDIINKGAADTQKHFASWLPKYKQLLKNYRYEDNHTSDYQSQRQSQNLLDTASALAAGLAAARNGRGLL